MANLFKKFRRFYFGEKPAAPVVDFEKQIRPEIQLIIDNIRRGGWTVSGESFAINRLDFFVCGDYPTLKVCIYYIDYGETRILLSIAEQNEIYLLIKKQLVIQKIKEDEERRLGELRALKEIAVVLKP